MRFDKPLIAVLIGMIVMIPLEIYTQIFKYLGFAKMSSLELTSMMLFKEGSWWLGLLTGTGTGGLATLLVYQSVRFLGSDYLYLKGAGIGMITYALIVVLFGILGGNDNLEQTVVSHFIHAIGASFAGMLAGYLVQKYLFTERAKIENKGKKSELHRYIRLPQPVRKKEQNNRFIKPRKIGIRGKNDYEK